MKIYIKDYEIDFIKDKDLELCEENGETYIDINHIQIARDYELFLLEDYTPSKNLLLFQETLDNMED